MTQKVSHIKVSHVQVSHVQGDDNQSPTLPHDWISPNLQVPSFS